MCFSAENQAFVESVVSARATANSYSTLERNSKRYTCLKILDFITLQKMFIIYTEICHAYQMNGAPFDLVLLCCAQPIQPSMVALAIRQLAMAFSKHGYLLSSWTSVETRP